MKIGIDGRFLTHPQKGGFKTYTTNLILSLARMDKENEYVVYLDRSHDSQRPLPDQENFTWKIANGEIPAIGLPWREQCILPTLARKDGLELLHSPCLTAPLVLGCPSVVTVHDLIWMNPVQRERFSFHQDLLVRYYGYVARQSAMHAAMILTVSNYSKSCITEKLGVHPERICVVYEAANSIFRTLTDDRQVVTAREKFQIQKDYIFAIGSADPRKNISTLLEAYARLPEEVQEQFDLVVNCTHALLVTDFTESINRLNIAGHTHLVSSVSDADLVALYNAAALFVFPSKSEGFGLPLLEAMACGTPCIAANNSSIPEVAGDAAVLIEHAEDIDGLVRAIVSILTNPALANELKAKGLKRAASFSWDQCAIETIGVYQRLANPGLMGR